MNCDLEQALPAWLAAIGTIAVAILAIWGDWFRSVFAGPKLELSLRDPLGDLNSRANGTRVIYYHITVTNTRTWSAAKAVRLMVVAVDKLRPGDTYLPEHLAVPIQLNWAFASFHEQFPTVVQDDICDFGFLDQGAARFELALYVRPNNFKGYVAANETMRVSIVASGHNVQPSKPLVIEVAWDGKWSADKDEMRRHLVIREVKE
ncbi:MAG: hypothetical protein ABSH49_08780 [Bryobacteraceae bacterium]|jgi:hypothetical protein